MNITEVAQILVDAFGEATEAQVKQVHAAIASAFAEGNSMSDIAWKTKQLISWVAFCKTHPTYENVQQLLKFIRDRRTNLQKRLANLPMYTPDEWYEKKPGVPQWLWDVFYATSKRLAKTLGRRYTAPAIVRTEPLELKR